MIAERLGAAPRLSGPIQDLRVCTVIDRLHASQRYPEDGGPRRHPGRDPADYAQYGFSIFPEQGELIYLLCRAMRARRVVEFATSVGMSTLYFAAAVRDNGGGTVIGSELVPAKVEVAAATCRTPGWTTTPKSDRGTRASPCASSAVRWTSP